MKVPLNCIESIQHQLKQCGYTTVSESKIWLCMAVRYINRHNENRVMFVTMTSPTIYTRELLETTPWLMNDKSIVKEMCYDFCKQGDIVMVDKMIRPFYNMLSSTDLEKNVDSGYCLGSYYSVLEEVLFFVHMSMIFAIRFNHHDLCRYIFFNYLVNIALNNNDNRISSRFVRMVLDNTADKYPDITNWINEYLVTYR